MRKDVGIIKGCLKKFFPDNIIQASYIKGKGVLSADGILIKTDVPFEEIKNKLQSITKYMCIIKSNEVYIERGYTAFNPQILECEYTDAEYIKIKEI